MICLYDMYIYIMCSHMYIFCYISLNKKTPPISKHKGLVSFVNFLRM